MQEEQQSNYLLLQLTCMLAWFPACVMSFVHLNSPSFLVSLRQAVYCLVFCLPSFLPNLGLCFLWSAFPQPIPFIWPHFDHVSMTPFSRPITCPSFPLQFALSTCLKVVFTSPFRHVLHSRTPEYNIIWHMYWVVTLSVLRPLSSADVSRHVHWHIVKHLITSSPWAPSPFPFFLAAIF